MTEFSQTKWASIGLKTLLPLASSTSLSSFIFFICPRLSSRSALSGSGRAVWERGSWRIMGACVGCRFVLALPQTASRQRALSDESVTLALCVWRPEKALGDNQKHRDANTTQFYFLIQSVQSNKIAWRVHLEEMFCKVVSSDYSQNKTVHV